MLAVWIQNPYSSLGGRARSSDFEARPRAVLGGSAAVVLRYRYGLVTTNKATQSLRSMILSHLLLIISGSLFDISMVGVLGDVYSHMRTARAQERHGTFKMSSWKIIQYTSSVRADLWVLSQFWLIQPSPRTGSGRRRNQNKTHENQKSETRNAQFVLHDRERNEPSLGNW